MISVRKVYFLDIEESKYVLKSYLKQRGYSCNTLVHEVKQSGEIHLVLDCDCDKIRMVMKAAQAVGMMTAYHTYLITNMVSHAKPLETKIKFQQLEGSSFSGS